MASKNFTTDMSNFTNNVHNRDAQLKVRKLHEFSCLLYGYSDLSDADALVRRNGQDTGEILRDCAGNGIPTCRDIGQFTSSIVFSVNIISLYLTDNFASIGTTRLLENIAKPLRHISLPFGMIGTKITIFRAC